MLPVSHVHNQESLAELCDHIRSCGQFAFDTEFVTEDSYWSQLCLIQVATPERLATIDPLKLEDLSAFWNLMADDSLAVTAHAADAELKFARRHLGAAPQPVFDIQIAAGLAGHGYPVSYKVLVGRVLGQRVRGGETRTEWRRRPLTDKQISYALEDVRYLLTVREKLESQLDQADRAGWALQEFEAQVRQSEPNSIEPWRRISRLHTLNRRQLAVLRELAAWREELARAEDRPVRTLVNNDILFEIARRMPKDKEEMFVFRGMNRRRLRKLADEILACVTRGCEVPESDCPILPPKPDVSERVRMLANLVATTMNCMCFELRLPPAMVASMSDLSGLVLKFLNDGGPPDSGSLSSGWRREVFAETFLSLLRGELSLKVSLDREIPVIIERAGPTGD